MGLGLVVGESGEPGVSGPAKGSKRVLLIIGGGIAAYKSLDVVRRLRELPISIRSVMTASAREFVTPLSVSTVCGEPVAEELFDGKARGGVGHIDLSRDADLILVCPASADLLARMASGLAQDLATAVLLAGFDRPILVAPAMNTRMWEHPATCRNVGWLRDVGVHFVGPEEGMLAEGEYGIGRLAEPARIVEAVRGLLGWGAAPLAGRKIVVTSGPTHEMLDPLRYIGNRSSGKQGHAIARALAVRGADVTLVTGPVHREPPRGFSVISVCSALEMAEAVERCQPCDVFIGAAAVSDWRVEQIAERKIRKGEQGAPSLVLVENPDIVARVGRGWGVRPALVVGFAAETEDVVHRAQEKRVRKGCDWIVANDVTVRGSEAEDGVMGSSQNQVHVVTAAGVEDWPRMSKEAVADALAKRIVDFLAGLEADDRGKG